MPTDEYDDDDRPRRPRDSRDDDYEDRPARPRRDVDDDYDRPRRPSDRGAGLGIASLVVGIISIPLCICSWFDIPLAITAIILGFVSRAQGGPRGTNTAGIICGFVSLGLIILLIVLALSGAIDPEKLKQMQKQ
ncbi:MAG TPA: DUF4190 domain-containing protein [Gemmataceae bacterium]|nr:DUF4190 domain-containing protein [Gemmataceae bacterium]